MSSARLAVDTMAEMADVRGIVERAFAAARALHGDLGVSIEPFGARIVETVSKHVAPAAPSAVVHEFARRLHTSDLYLAVGCAHRLEAAWSRFGQIYRRHIDDVLRYMSRTTYQARDLADNVFVDLFLPDRTGRCRIASYDGRSSLATWLHVVVSHRRINEGQRKCNQVERNGSVPDTPDFSVVDAVESRMRADRYDTAIQRSISAACVGLTSQERLLLLWRYDQGLLLSEIARLLHVDPATVNRRLGRLHHKLRIDVLALLTSRYNLGPAAIQECLEDLIENRADVVPLLPLLRRLASCGEVTTTKVAQAAGVRRPGARNVHAALAGGSC